jgi:hypothetical protein
LFLKLENSAEAVPFSDGAHELARLLGLVAEYWSGNSVLDRSPAPCHPSGYVTYKDWWTCRRVRLQMLDAAASQRRGVSSEPAPTLQKA